MNIFLIIVIMFVGLILIGMAESVKAFEPTERKACNFMGYVLIVIPAAYFVVHVLIKVFTAA